MKERIVIKDTEQTFNIVAQFPTQVKPTDFEHTKEQVPETWEELKELCKGITVGLKICKDGTIYCNEYFLARNRTPAQMWDIIQSLFFFKEEEK